MVELRPRGIHKGLIVERLLAGGGEPGLLVAMGDDTVDEDLFAALPENGLSIHVGPRASGAHLRLRDVSAGRHFLRALLEVSR